MHPSQIPDSVRGFAGPRPGTVLGTAMVPGSVRRRSAPMKLKSVQTNPAALKRRIPVSLMPTLAIYAAYYSKATTRWSGSRLWS